MDQPLHNYLRPGIVLCVAYPEAAENGAALLRAVDVVATDPFFSSVEVRYVPSVDARRRMIAVLRASCLDVVYETNPRLKQLGLNLNSADSAARTRALDEVKRAIDEAIELGAVRVNIASGPAPDPAGREEGADALVDSLCALADYAIGHHGPRLALEPFFGDPGNSYLVGPTVEAVSLAHLVREVYPDFELTLDTGYMALLGEDVATTLALAAPYLGQLHLANAARGSGNPAPPLGALGGVYDASHLSELLLALFRSGFLGGGRRPLVVFRVAPDGADRPEWVIAGAKRTLAEAWARL